MKIGVGSLGVIDVLGIEEGFAALNYAGFESMDFYLGHYLVCKDEMDENYYDVLCDEKHMMAHYSQVKAAAEKYGIVFGQCHAPAPTYVPRKPRETEIAQKIIRKSIEMCAYLGCEHLIIHPICDGSARFPTLTKEQEMEANIAYFSSLIPDLKKYHVTCCIENAYALDWGTKQSYMGGFSDMNEAVWYIDTLNEMAGEKCFAFCLDIGHAVMLGIDPYFAFEKLGHRLEALHIHDNDGVHDDHIAPYLGVVNWKRFIKGLRDNGYKGDISFETVNSCMAYPKELVPDVLKLISATGRYFRNQVLAEE